MLVSHRWMPSQTGFLCRRCFDFTNDPTRKRKGCAGGIVADSLNEMAKHLAAVNAEIDKLEKRMRRHAG